MAYRPAEVGAGDQIPVPGSLARENLTQGGLILFKVPNTVATTTARWSSTSRRPTAASEATVDLDV